MSYIIDMHCHIVPGVDDGSQDIEESMALIEMEYDEGVRKIICTPHYMRNKNVYSSKELDKKFQLLRDKVAEKHSDMMLYLG